MINRRPSPKGEKEILIRNVNFASQAVRVQPQMNTMKNTEMKRVEPHGEKSKYSFWLEWKQQLHSGKIKKRRGFLRSSDGDGGPETEEADRWSCSSTDSLHGKLEPPTADCWTASSFEISSATFLFSSLVFFLFCCSRQSVHGAS